MISLKREDLQDQEGWITLSRESVGKGARQPRERPGGEQG
jgi:hypothetical protein